MVNRVLAHVREFGEAVHSGGQTRYTGKAIPDIINIG